MPAEFLLFLTVLIGMVFSACFIALRHIEAEGLAVAERAQQVLAVDPHITTALLRA